MPLPLAHKRRAAVSYIIKKMKGSDDFDKMKEYNESSPEHMTVRTEVEKDYSSALDTAASEVIEAIQKEDAASLKKSLKMLVKLTLDECESEKD